MMDKYSPLNVPGNGTMLSLLQGIISQWNLRGLPHLAWWMRRIVLGRGLRSVMFQNRFRFLCNCEAQYNVLQAYGFIHRAVDRVLHHLIADIPGAVQFFDIGANIGFVSLLACSIAPNRVHSTCFEPNPDAFQKLQSNFAMNAFQATLNNSALGMETGQLEMHLGLESSNSSLVAGGIAGVPITRTERVAVNTLDNYCFEKGVLPNIVKVDVEGFEPFVLQGGVGVIRSAKPYMIIEVNPRTLTAGGYSGHSLIKDIKKLGYKVFYIDRMQVGLRAGDMSSRRRWKGLSEVEGSDDHENHLFDILAIAEGYF